MTSQPMEQVQPLRIGVLGAARIAPNALIRPARRAPGVQVAAIAARDPQRARALAEQHQIPRVHNSYAALIRDPELDAIYNPLPNSLHCEWSIQALQAGKHVLCEKPMANNALEAEQMAQAARTAERVLVEAFHNRYHPLLLRMKEIINSGELGAIHHLSAHFCTILRRWNDIRYDYALGGGATMDLGCYTVNLLRYLASAEPTVVRAQARLLRPQVDRWMEADFRFADGRTANMSCALLSLRLLRISAQVVGEQGTMRVLNPILPHWFHRLQVRTAQGTRSERVAGESTYVHQLRAFAQMVRGGPPMPTDAADAVANLRVIDAIYERAGLQRRGLVMRNS
jgi:predicted dehydrogenase